MELYSSIKARLPSVPSFDPNIHLSRADRTLLTMDYILCGSTQTPASDLLQIGCQIEDVRAIAKLRIKTSSALGAKMFASATTVQGLAMGNTEGQFLAGCGIVAASTLFLLENLYKNRAGSNLRKNWT